ncbi:transposase [Candidatus Curtissbacteria bacterium]|nr:transposase [Candidatus Curtissbacteria bacterium]
MPAKNSLKQYIENSYYHLYNRGVEKRLVFQEPQDHAVFLSYLKEYLLPKNAKELSEKLTNPNTSYKEKDKIIKLLRLNNFSDEIELVAYCLMPNHFHMLVKQKKPTSIDIFMNSLGTRYTMYFNRKYNRVGSLWQAVYKAVLVNSDEQLLHLVRYIHKQALTSSGDEVQPNSHIDYLRTRKTEWIKPNEILSYFSQSNPKLSYKQFVHEAEDPEIIRYTKIED